jgi:hypothetical protein
MSQDFKFKFNQMRENDPTQEQQTYAGESHVRNVCFFQPDGKAVFLNYGYLTSAQYDPTESCITLFFTSHTVILKGANLETLFQEFFSHIPKSITCTDERYNEIEKHSYIINEMHIVKV